MVLVVIGPDDTTHFIGHFKAEVAHRLNAIMGWSKRTVWCEGYDSPVILTPGRALIAIAYLYANPAKDNLEGSIEQYPGFTTWKMSRDGAHRREWKFLSRPAYRQLPNNLHTRAGYEREAARLAKKSKTTFEFSIEPDAWLEAFGINDAAEKDKWNETLVARVRKLEDRARKKRRKEARHPVE